MSSMIANPSNSSQDSWSRPGYQSQQSASSLHAGQSEGISSNAWFASGLPTPPGSRVMNGISVGSTVPTFPPTQPYPTRHPSENSFQQRPSYHSQNNVDYSQHSRMNSLGGGSSIAQSQNSASNLIASHLQIPESVNKSKGSLAEFAAELTCLFWFESSSTLEYSERLPEDAPTDRSLIQDAVPSTGFRKWVTMILSTTQVGKNVILLALMFIYRLKKFNPGVSGKRGSEFRLLSIALMLGNKFLDDNTYTNKTWAEVSGISVTEIHVMEVEFLQNMKYNLYVSELGWKAWKSTLGRLGSFYEKALKFTSEPPPMTPLPQSYGQKLPSPPSTHHSQYPYPSAGTPSHGYVGLPNPTVSAPRLPPSPLRQQRATSMDLLNGRKRSLDTASEQPANKRLHVLSTTNNPSAGMLTPLSYPSHDSGTASVPPFGHGPQYEAASHAEVPRLPMPRLAVPPSTSNSNQLAPLSMPVDRAMSSVYPPTTTATWSQPVTPVSAVPSNLYQGSIPNLGDFSRSHSHVPSVHTSPVGYSATGTPVLPGLSPSYFLTNRNSPYRPVRNVNTLINPPPSAALQNHVRNIDHDQIRYQPLSKTNAEHRVGPIPFYQPDAWQASNLNTPTQQKWPYRF